MEYKPELSSGDSRLAGKGGPNGAMLAAMLAAVTDMIFIVDGGGRFLAVSPTGPRLLCRPPGELVGRTLSEVFPEQKAEVFRKSVRSALDTGRAAEIEYPMELNGAEFWFEAKVSPNDGGLAVVAIRDITRRKAAENGLKAGLAEKKVLLREIHHRVKNNLQVVLGLLNMHSGKVTDPCALAAFRESRARIRAMGLVHESLCRSADLARINMRDYAETLTRDIISAYGRTHDVELECHVCDCEVNADIAMPLGLILNELVSNSLKHAFDYGRSGSVRVSMTSGPLGFRLEVEDDGPGMPADLKDRAGNTLGLELVRTLARQLSGTFEIPAGGAARFIVLFPI